MSRYCVTKSGVVYDEGDMESGGVLKELSNGKFVPAFSDVSIDEFLNACPLSDTEVRSYIEKSAGCQKDSSVDAKMNCPCGT